MSEHILRRYSISVRFIVVLGVGLLLGLASVWLSPLWILIGFAGVIYLLIAWVMPEIALLSILVLTSTIIDINSLPSVPIGFGHLIISDFLVSIPIGIIIFRGVAKSGFTLVHTALDIPLLVFYGIAILSTVIAIYIFHTVTLNQSLGEVRNVSFYLTFFIVTNMIRDERRLRRLWNGITLITVIVALAMIAQYILGDAVPILPGRVETLGTGAEISYGVTRVLPPGQSLVLVVFIAQLVSLIISKSQVGLIGKLVQIFVLGFAVLLTFNRSFWVATGLALLLVVILISVGEKIRFLRIAFLTISLGTIVLVPISILMKDQAAELFSGAVNRLATIFDPNTLNESSIRYRDIEDAYALPQIASHPLIGMGLGSYYRPFDSRIDFTRHPSWDRKAYIHNGHLWVLLKTGLIGYISLLWLFYRFISRGFLNWRHITTPLYQGIMLSFVATLIGVLIATIVNPILFSLYWAPLIGIMLGMNEVILKIHRDQFRITPSVGKK